MNELLETPVECPYCGEPIVLLIDPSQPEQNYIEDCQVCCQPMTIRAEILQDGSCRVEACSEDDG